MPPQMSQILSHLESQSELVGILMREVVKEFGNLSLAMFMLVFS